MIDFGSVSLRCWPEVLLFSVVVRAGNDIKRSSPLISAGVPQSPERSSSRNCCCARVILMIIFCLFDFRF